MRLKLNKTVGFLAKHKYLFTLILSNFYKIIIIMTRSPANKIPNTPDRKTIIHLTHGEGGGVEPQLRFF